MEYLPFEITEYNNQKEDERVVLNSDEGRIYVRIGKLDISIKQSDDGEGVIIDCTDAELSEQDLGTMTVWYDEIEELPLNEDGSHPLGITAVVSAKDLKQERTRLVEFIEYLEAMTNDKSTRNLVQQFMRKSGYWPTKQ